MRGCEAATDALHQLTEFIAADLRVELFSKRDENATPLRRNLPVQQIVKSHSHGVGRKQPGGQ